MSTAFDSTNHQANSVLAYALICYECDPDRGMTLSELRTRTDLEIENSSHIMRQLENQGWFFKTRSSSKRSPHYALTPAGVIRAKEAVVARERYKQEASDEWDREHDVFGRVRTPNDPALTDRQILECGRGYWQSQIAQGEAPIDAPPEVKQDWERIRRRLTLRLGAPNPHRSKD